MPRQISDDLKQTLASQEKQLEYQAISQEDDDLDEDDSGFKEKEKEQSWGMRTIESTWFQNIMALVIVANGAVIGLETDIRNYDFDDIELGFLVIFTFEVTFKLCVEGREFFNPFFADFMWNQFDLMIVGLGIFDAVSTILGTSGSGGFATIFRMVRLMRILRIFRLLKFLKKLYLLAVGLIEAFKAIVWVSLLMSFTLYVVGIVLVRTVGRPPHTDPHYDFMSEHFGSIRQSMITCFILMSSPNLPIYQDETGLLDEKPCLTIFLIGFITFGSFGMIGMLTGVINQSMFENNELAKEEKRLEHDMMRKSLGGHTALLYKLLPLDETGRAKVKDLHHIGGRLSQLLDETGVDIAHGDVLKFLSLMDEDESGYIDMRQFGQAMERIAEGVGPLALLEVQHHVSLCNRKLSRNIAKVQTVEEKIESQMLHTSKEVDRILAAVVENGQKIAAVVQQTGAKMEQQETDRRVGKETTNPPSREDTSPALDLAKVFQPQETPSENAATCASTVAAVAKSNEDLDLILHRVTDKQLEALELTLPSIVSKQMDTILAPMRDDLGRVKFEELQTSVQGLMKKLDQATESKLRLDSEQSPLTHGDAAGGLKTQVSASSWTSVNSVDRPPAVDDSTDKHFKRLEEKLLGSIAELGGVLLDGMADLLSQNQANTKDWHLQREHHIAHRFQDAVASALANANR